MLSIGSTEIDPCVKHFTEEMPIPTEVSFTCSGQGAAQNRHGRGEYEAMTTMTPLKTSTKAFAAAEEADSFSIELVVFVLSMATIIALAIAPHQIGLGF